MTSEIRPLAVRCSAPLALPEHGISFSPAASQISVGETYSVSCSGNFAGNEVTCLETGQLEEALVCTEGKPGAIGAAAGAMC